MCRTTHYQDTRAEGTVDSAGNGTTDDETPATYLNVIVGWLSTEYIPNAVIHCMCQGIWAHSVAAVPASCSINET